LEKNLIKFKFVVNQLQKEMRCWWGKCCVYSKFETIKSTYTTNESSKSGRPM